MRPEDNKAVARRLFETMMQIEGLDHLVLTVRDVAATRDFYTRLLGMEAKTRQYVDGSAFVRAVVDRIGVEDFNAIWSSRETLPTREEIADWLTPEALGNILWPSMFPPDWRELSNEGAMQQARFYCLEKAEKIRAAILALKAAPAK